jgi:transposase
MEPEDRIRNTFEALRDGMNEAFRRRWAGAEAQSLGYGGMTIVARATGISFPTIRRGIREINAGAPLSSTWSRQYGGGRKRADEADTTLRAELERLVEPYTRGDPQSPLRWTCKSTHRLAQELTARGHSVTARTISRLLVDMGYSLQANRKTREGASHPDRNAQFEYINAKVALFQELQQPAVSVDTKKKELIGDFYNRGREWRPKGDPQQVRGHDFVDKRLGKVAPYGVYDMLRNQGWVNVGISNDTAEFAVESIRRWWRIMGRRVYHHATDLLIVADSGGSHSSRSHLWKACLPTSCERDWLEDLRVPLPSWNKQMEQDRASALQPYHDQLAWPASGQS